MNITANKKKGVAASGALIACIALGALVMPKSGEAQPQQGGITTMISPTSIPWEVQTAAATESLREAYQYGSVDLNARRRSVSIMWGADYYANQEPDYTRLVDVVASTIGDSRVCVDIQTVTTAFYPTACAILDTDSMIVGGVNNYGGAVIEKWTLGWPVSMPDPEYDSADALWDVAVVQPSIAKTTIFSEPSPGAFKFITGLAGLRKASGPPTDFLVQFDEPNDISVMNLASGTMSLLASETNPTGSLGIIPSLVATDYVAVGFSDRIGWGYVYNPGRGRVDLHRVTAGTQPILLLLDTNRDGIVESFLEVTRENWVADGWSDLGGYVSEFDDD